MKPAPRPAAFVLAASDQGSMIVNRFDAHMIEPGSGIGVGYNLLETCSYDPGEVDVGTALLELAKIYRGSGVVALDCGANIGVHMIGWARAMTGWGSVLAFEAQERLFYALAGNLALNNCFNASARHAALSTRCGAMKAPVPDYCRHGSFGSLELRQRPDTEYIGQEIDYSDAGLVEIPCLSIDSLNLQRVDLIKIDVEGMELEVLEGARAAIMMWRPLLIVESLKADKPRLQGWIEAQGYHVFGMGANFVAVHAADPIRSHIQPGTGADAVNSPAAAAVQA